MYWPSRSTSAVALESRQHAFVFLPGMRCRFAFGNEEVEQQRHQAAGGRVDDKQREKIAVGDETANGWTDDPGQVGHHAQDAEALLALFFRQNIGDHGLVGRSGDIRKQPDDHRQREQQLKRIHQPQRQRTERAEHQPEQDQFAPAKTVGERAADHVAKQPKDGKQAQHQPGLRHADAKALRDVEREEREQQRPADPVDERDEHHHPELARELVINFLQTG